jgi:hypothetical protein
MIGSSGAKSAARRQVAGQQAGIDEQRRQFDITRTDYAPYRQIGNNALNQLAELYGIPAYQQEPAATALPAPVVGSIPGGMAGAIVARDLRGRSDPRGRVFDNNTGAQIPATPDLSTAQSAAPAAPVRSAGPIDYSRFYSSPDYQFALTEGLKGVENSAAARGGLYSGNAMRALQERGAGIASQQYGNYVNRLAALAGIGQSATQSGAQLGAQMSGNVSNLLAGQGDARASGIVGQTNAWGGAINQLGTIAGDYFKPKKDMYAMNYTGYTPGRV